MAFTAAGDEYALPIDAVQEIIRYVKPRRLSGETPWMAGVINLRDTIISVCDLAIRLGRAAQTGDDAKIVVVACPSGVAGIVVDDVTGVLTVDPDHRAAIPGGATDFMREIAQVGDRLIVILDPGRLLADLGVDAPPGDAITG